MTFVRVEGLHFRYPPFDPNSVPSTDAWALEDVAFEIERGEFLGITGTTGSGKTTLCLALTGLVPQQTSGTIRGDVWIDARNTKRTPVIDLASRVGIVFQEPEANLLGLTVEDEVAFGLENRGVDREMIEERLSWALETVGADDLRYRSAARLSGGQIQRVAIASVLATLPELLILDDPTAELDPAGTADVLDVISAIRLRSPHTTVVMTSGDCQPIVDGADRLMVLDRGRIQFHGDAEQFLARALEFLCLGVAVPPLDELAVELNRHSRIPLRLRSVPEAADAIREHLSH